MPDPEMPPENAGEPPANADDWSNEQWIAWLKKTDAEHSSEVEQAPATTLGRITHSTGGQILGNAMTGLARALYGPQDKKQAIVVDSSEPESEQPVEVHLDPDHPDQSYAVLRQQPEPSE